MTENALSILLFFLYNYNKQRSLRESCLFSTSVVQHTQHCHRSTMGKITVTQMCNRVTNPGDNPRYGYFFQTWQQLLPGPAKLVLLYIGLMGGIDIVNSNCF